MKTFLMATATTLLMAATAQAQDFTLWSSATFTPPFTDGVIATSAEFVNSPFENTLKISIRYEALDPSPCNCGVIAVLEEELAPGIWIPLITQQTGLNAIDQVSNFSFVIAPHTVSFPGDEVFMDLPGTDQDILAQSVDSVAPDTFRVRILATTPSLLTGSVTLSGNGRWSSR